MKHISRAQLALNMQIVISMLEQFKHLNPALFSGGSVTIPLTSVDKMIDILGPQSLDKMLTHNDSGE
jgi:hypothetical protein